MKKSLGEIMSDPRIWEMSEEAKQRGRQRIMEIAKSEMESGMLTYKDEESVKRARGQVPGIRHHKIMIKYTEEYEGRE